MEFTNLIAVYFCVIRTHIMIIVTLENNKLQKVIVFQLSHLDK